MFRFVSAYGEPSDGQSFQRLAQYLGVEAIIVGSVTDFQMYYPPRMAMTVHWYAANEGFHPIPAGYGLPWGTDAEKEIPRRIVRETEFELARSQLATQTPLEMEQPTAAMPPERTTENTVRQVADLQPLEPPVPSETGGPELVAPGEPELPVNGLRDDSYSWHEHDGGYNSDDVDGPLPRNAHEVPIDDGFAIEAMEAPLPAHWPNPTDLIPNPPAAYPGACHRKPQTDTFAHEDLLGR